MEEDNNGVIYKITNLINGKIYIGQTREYYGKKQPNAKRGSKLGIKFGIEGRFKRHVYKASFFDPIKERNMLYNAIKKYGSENFIIEKLLNCSIDKLDEHEIRLIAEHDSMNPEIGYNIQSGGTGKHTPKDKYNVNDDVRKKISKAQRDSEDLNITPYIKNNVVIGYRARRRVDGVCHEKIYCSTKFTPEENKKLCEQWLANLKSGIIDEKKENSHNVEIPKNISYLKNKKGVICGYRMNLLINGIRYDKSFQEGNSMEEKLAKAIAYKNHVLNISNNH